MPKRPVPAFVVEVPAPSALVDAPGFFSVEVIVRSNACSLISPLVHGTKYLSLLLEEQGRKERPYYLTPYQDHRSNAN